MIYYIVYENGVFKVSSQPKRKSRRMYFASLREAQDYVKSLNKRNKRKEQKWKTTCF